MNEPTEDRDEPEAPDISSWLLSFLDVRRKEYENQFGAPRDADERLLYDAIDAFSRYVQALVTSGVVPAPLEHALAEFMPGDSVDTKVRHLMAYRAVHHRLEIDVAEEVCSRLASVHQRIMAVVLLTQHLLGFRPSLTAQKYFERATTAFLAGYATETVVMCGAVLEAALRERIPDELLLKQGMKPRYKRSGFSIGQRMQYAHDHAVFTESQRARAWDVINWRNDAVHVQPDIGPSPVEALSSLALLLPVTLPGELFS